MATRFHLPDGAATDLIAMTLPEFFTPKASDFLQFSIDVTPVPVARQSFWQSSGRMLQLLRPLPRSPYPGRRSVLCRQRSGLRTRTITPSSPCCGATLGAPSATRGRATTLSIPSLLPRRALAALVRFTWQPVDGVMTTDPDDPPVDDYLAEELQRVLYDPPRFLLMMQIGEAGDDLNDPSRPTPPRQPRVIMGALTIDKVPDDQIEFCERLAFNPMRLAPASKLPATPCCARGRGLRIFAKAPAAARPVHSRGTGGDGGHPPMENRGPAEGAVVPDPLQIFRRSLLGLEKSDSAPAGRAAVRGTTERKRSAHDESRHAAQDKSAVGRAVAATAIAENVDEIFCRPR